MLGSALYSFTDPDDYEVSLHELTADLVLTQPGAFAARLTRLALPRLHLVSVQETLPRVAYVSLPPTRVFVSFFTQPASTAVWKGLELRPGDILVHSRGERAHHRATGASHWTFLSLAPELFAAHGRALTGQTLDPQAIGQIRRPKRADRTHLLDLSARVRREVERRPFVRTHPEIARSLEQELMHALVTCLTSGDAPAESRANLRHTAVMAGFEDLLAAHHDQTPPVPELCATLGTSDRTLRACCAAFLGMSPGQYAHLRRLKRARSALLHADPATARVAEIARRFGIIQAGRFAVEYRTAYGETPSTTVQRAKNVWDDQNLPLLHSQSVGNR
jgi:AraC-like DNA-binding protein